MHHAGKLVGTPPAHGLSVGDVYTDHLAGKGVAGPRGPDGWRFACSIDIDCAHVIADDDDAQPHTFAKTTGERESPSIVAIHLDALPFNIAFAPNLPSSMTKEMRNSSSLLGMEWIHSWRQQHAPSSVRVAHDAVARASRLHTGTLMTGKNLPDCSTLHKSLDNPFAKIVLFPMVLKSVHCPDTALISGKHEQITVRFTNPSGSPYNLHGAHFSISFNFICQ